MIPDQAGEMSELTGKMSAISRSEIGRAHV